MYQAASFAEVKNTRRTKYARVPPKGGKGKIYDVRTDADARCAELTIAEEPRRVAYEEAETASKRASVLDDYRCREGRLCIRITHREGESLSHDERGTRSFTYSEEYVCRASRNLGGGQVWFEGPILENGEWYGNVT